MIMITTDMLTTENRLQLLEQRVQKLEHDKAWDNALDDLGLLETDVEEWLGWASKSTEPDEVLANPFTKPRTHRDLNPEAAFVEQIELFIHDQTKAYHVRLRFDDDTTEKLGIFQLHSTAYEYAREQARRYHVALFDSTYEDLVD